MREWLVLPRLSCAGILAQARDVNKARIAPFIRLYGILGAEEGMTTITIPLPEDHVEKLKEAATRLNISPEELVRLSIEDLLARPDDAFQRAADYVMKKNADLYQRLA